MSTAATTGWPRAASPLWLLDDVANVQAAEVRQEQEQDEDVERE